jgi:hypothetical protein
VLKRKKDPDLEELLSDKLKDIREALIYSCKKHPSIAKVTLALL